LLLEKLGHRADVAVNGAEAVAAVERERYDAVLMDVQMPELDGLEATRRIHARLGGERPRIIAATANALQDERDRCLAAGMDDYLSKPIRMDDLAAALGRVPARTDGAAATLDPSALEELRATVGEASTSELVTEFLAEAPRLLAVLDAARRHDDRDELRRAAHTLKSNAATFGATRLAELSRELEAISEAAVADGIRALVTSVAAEFERVQVALASARSTAT
jgi:CheY-like chemotaxis protein